MLLEAEEGVFNIQPFGFLFFFTNHTYFLDDHM